MPERPARGWPHAALHEDSVECLEMLLFLGRHMLDRGARRARPHHGQLSLIDSPRAIFTRLVDADGAGDGFCRCEIAGQGAAACGGGAHGRRMTRKAPIKQMKPSTAAYRKSYPAME